MPAVSYRLGCRHIDDSAVNWHQNLVLAVSHTQGDSNYIANLDSGSWHRASRRALTDPRHQLEPCCTYTTRFGILSAHFDGSLVFTPVGEMPVKVYQLPDRRSYDFVWLSSAATVRSGSTLTIIAASSNRIDLFQNLQLVREITIGNDQLDAVTMKGVYPFNRDEFMVLTQHAIYRLTGNFEYKHILNIDTAQELHIVYPYVMITGSHGISRLNLETNEQTIYTESSPAKVSYDESIVVAYTRIDQMLTAWSIKGYGEPIWSIPSPLVQETPHSDELITAIALNAIVVVCGGFKGNLCVLDVLNGEKLPTKKMKKIAAEFDPDWVVPAGHLPDERQRPNLSGTSKIHLEPTCEPRMAHIVKNSVTVYDATVDKNPGSTKKHIKPQRKRTVDARYIPEEVDLHEDYTIRGINRTNMTPDTLRTEGEQLQTAVALSESHNPVLSEQEQMKLAITESMLQRSQSMREEEQLRLALELSMCESSGSLVDNLTSGDAMEVDEELQKAIDASMMEQ